nr:transposase [Bradyrhizobium sp. IAR9]
MPSRYDRRQSPKPSESRFSDRGGRFDFDLRPALGHFWLKFSSPNPIGWEERRDDKGLAVFGHSKRRHPEAGQRRDCGRGDLRQDRDQPATYFNWKKTYDGLLPTKMRRLKRLDKENAKLKKLVADLSLEKEMLQDESRRKLAGSAR